MKRLLTALVFVVFLCGTAQAEFFDLGFTDGTDPLTPYMDSWVLEKDCSETEVYAVDFDPLTTTDVQYTRTFLGPTPLLLVDLVGVTQADLLAYYSDKPDPWKLYLSLAALGFAPFAYIATETIDPAPAAPGIYDPAILDGAVYFISNFQEDTPSMVPMRIPCDFPCGKYTVATRNGETSFSLIVEDAECSPDNDGVPYGEDFCPNTVADEPDDEKGLGTNRWIWDGKEWITSRPNGKNPKGSFDMEYTFGCSCEQILAVLEEKTDGSFEGHWKFGCSSSIITDWHEGIYKVDSVEVPSAGDPVNSSVTLFDTEQYLLNAYGTYIFMHIDKGTAEAPLLVPLTADAEYFQIGTDSWFGGALNILDLFVDGVAQDWGVFNMDHMYWLEMSGTGAPAEFKLNDWLNPADNIGSLFVDIYVKLW